MLDMVGVGRAALTGGHADGGYRLDRRSGSVKDLNLQAARLFEILTACAANRERCPTNSELSESLGLQAAAERHLRTLRKGGFIKIAYFCGRLFRQVTILTGPHSGKSTASKDEVPYIMKNRGRYDCVKHHATQAVPESDRRCDAVPHCAWCGVAMRFPGACNASCCCADHAKEYARHGHSANKAQIEARLNRPPGPKGCATVDEWLAAGGQVYREAPAYGATTGQHRTRTGDTTVPALQFHLNHLAERAGA